MNSFKFSVIIGLNNNNMQVEECINSIINQTIGFEEHIQIIVVGSKRGQIDELHENIKNIYLESDNISKMRNKAMEYVKGEVVNFCEPNYILEANVFEKIDNIFRKQKEISIVSLGNDIEDNCVIVDMEKDYEQIQTTIHNIFYKKELLQKQSFNEKIRYDADVLFNNKQMLRITKFGAIKGGIIELERITNKEKFKDKKWYLETLENVYGKLLQESKNNIKYIQYLVACNLKERIKSNEAVNVLNKEELQKYINYIQKLYKEIDDDVILEQNTSHIYKKYALDIKYNRQIETEEGQKNKEIEKLCKEQIPNICKIQILEIKNDILYLEGRIGHVIDTEKYQIHFEDQNKNKYELKLMEYGKRDIVGLDNKKIYMEKMFKVEIPIEKFKKIKCVYTQKDEKKIKVRIHFGEFSKISKIQNSYHYSQKYIINVKENFLRIRKVGRKEHAKYEVKYLLARLKEKEIGVIINRLIYYIVKIFQKKEIWLISDRPEEAKDNGIAFFKYINKNYKNINSYFVISKKSNKYKEIKKIGKVVDYGSTKHKILRLLSKNEISSQGLYNVFENKHKYYKDLLNYNYIFLQHGIIKDDLSNWLHYLHKNMKIFVTSVKAEYESIVNGEYGYDNNVVKLLGLPRFDYLENEQIKKIALLPTWRNNLVGDGDKKTKERKYVEDFKETKYCKYYNEILNSKKLDTALKQYGYTLEFYIHPTTISQAKDFYTTSENIKIYNTTANYSKLFKESSLLITDYSSVAFDFAYLNKPIIYTQFDKDTFFQNHSYSEGYFDYEKHGMGKVLYNLEDTIDEIIRNIKNSCILEQKYRQRANDFFEYRDRGNCKRVFDEIIKL